MKQTIQERAIAAITACFKANGIHVASNRTGKWPAQLSRWMHGGTMTRRSAERIMARITPTGRVRRKK